MTTAVIFHTDFGDSGQVPHFEKDHAIAGGFLILCVRGEGRFAVDRVLDGSRRGWHSGRVF